MQPELSGYLEASSGVHPMYGNLFIHKFQHRYHIKLRLVLDEIHGVHMKQSSF
jgi:hypothetical protein